LLIVLWVRSYWRHDTIQYYPPQAHLVYLASDAGTLAFGQGQFVRNLSPAESRWNFESVPIYAYRNRIAAKIFRGFQRDGYGHCAIPHWFPVSLVLLCAPVPWLPSRFSLRTLLIATTLVAVILGLVVWLSN
jgi:hypothetical protein